ncbi:hypothetical protein PBI_SCTP2_380 [Salicola phage SCTP-2]|nr:hypothetical protein PBI_SCTP2_380 [Salicola phage SCTP-2]
MIKEEEIWKDVDDYPEYFMISSFGRVWSKRTNKILKQTIGKTGYPVISSKIGGRKGKSICKKVHRWVANAFIDNLNNRSCVNHIDGNKTNNYWKNLEWCTYSENTKHAYKNNLIEAKCGEEHSSSVLSLDFIKQIENEYVPYSKTNGLRALARKYNVKHNTLSNALNNVSKYYGK